MSKLPHYGLSHFYLQHGYIFGVLHTLNRYWPHCAKVCSLLFAIYWHRTRCVSCHKMEHNVLFRKVKHGILKIPYTQLPHTHNPLRCHVCGHFETIPVKTNWHYNYCEYLTNYTMGGSQSSPIPGGGTEGYHVLRVCVVLSRIMGNTAKMWPVSPVSIQYCHFVRPLHCTEPCLHWMSKFNFTPHTQHKGHCHA